VVLVEAIPKLIRGEEDEDEDEELVSVEEVLPVLD
jgi:hypothetical protein